MPRGPRARAAHMRRDMGAPVSAHVPLSAIFLIVESRGPLGALGREGFPNQRLDFEDSMKRPKVTVTSLAELYAAGQKIAVVTAYDFTMATLLDEAGVDVLMVGDSLGMVIQGQETTLPVTLEQMIYHSSAVARARPSAHIVCDLPFLSYQTDDSDALRSAGRLVKEGGAESVKLEGGVHVAAAVEKIVRAGIPVMGHVGLVPQSVHRMGGFRVQGRSQAEAERIIEDAKSIEEAGAYAIVVEGVPSEVGRAVTAAVSVPTIGIGAGRDTSGQVLVCTDLLAMGRGHVPKFAKSFASIGDAIVRATQDYAGEVRSGSFPDAAHSFRMKEGEVIPHPTAPDGREPGS